MTECPKHPGVAAVGTCARCGSYFCAAEARRIDDATYCGECAARGDVDWLGKHYAKFVGKRSALAWTVLALGVGAIALGIAMQFGASLAPGERLLAVGFIVWGAANVAIISGKPWARWLPLTAAFGVGVLVALASREFNVVAGFFVALMLSVFALSIITDVRTRLFFRVPVPRDALQKHYDRYGSNPLAITASRLAFVSLIVPGLGLATLVMGVIALTRVNAKATPPVGNVSAALGAIVFSIFTSLIWLTRFL